MAGETKKKEARKKRDATGSKVKEDKAKAKKKDRDRKYVKTPKKETLIKALRIYGGNIGKVAERFGWKKDRVRVYKWIDKYDLRSILDESRILMIDLAEDNILDSVQTKDKDDSRLVLSTLGREQGCQDKIIVEEERPKMKPNEVEDELKDL